MLAIKHDFEAEAHVPDPSPILRLLLRVDIDAFDEGRYELLLHDVRHCRQVGGAPFQQLVGGLEAGAGTVNADLKLQENAEEIL